MATVESEAPERKGGVDEEVRAVVDTGDKPRRRKRKRKRKAELASNDANNDANVETLNDDNDGGDQKSKLSEVDQTVFVEGIPYSCTEEDLQQFFLDHLNSGNSICSIKNIRLPRWPDTGRVRGYGHVVFGSKSEQQAALMLNGKYLKDRYLSIQAAKTPRSANGQGLFEKTGIQGEPSRTLVLHNLSYEADESDIEAVLSKYGPIVKGGIRVVRHNATRQSRGFCYVEFQNLESAEQVVAHADKVSIRGRQCRVDYDQNEIKINSFRTASGRLWKKEFGKVQNKK